MARRASDKGRPHRGSSPAAAPRATRARSFGARAALVLGGLLGVFAWAPWRGGAEPPAGPAKPRPAEGGASAPPADAVAERAALPPSSPAPGGGSTERAERDDAERLRAKRLGALEDLRHLTRYPPDARPLDREQRDLFEPHRRYDEPQALSALAGERREPDEARDLYVSLTGPRYEVLPGEPIAATLTVTRGHPSRPDARAMPVVVEEATLRKVAQPEPVPVGAFPLNDDGEHGDERAHDGVYGAAMPTAFWPGLRGYAGGAYVVVRFRVAPSAGAESSAPEAPLTRTLDLVLAGDAVAVFTGEVEETLTGGALVLTPKLVVREPGTYLVRGLLFDARNEPVGYATFRGELGEGPAGAPLRFPGLLFHEARAEAPFVLRTVTGRRLASGGEAFDRPLADKPGEYGTARYARSAFSTAEWDNPSRRRVLGEAARLADENPRLVVHDKPTVVVDVSGAAP